MPDAIARKNATEIRTNFILLPSQSSGLFQMKKMRLLKLVLTKSPRKKNVVMVYWPTYLASNADATQFFMVKNAKKITQKITFQG